MAVVSNNKEIASPSEVDLFKSIYKDFEFKNINLNFTSSKFNIDIVKKSKKENEPSEVFTYVLCDLIYPSKWFRDDKTGQVKFEITYMLKDKFYKKIINQLDPSDLISLLSSIGFVLKDNKFEYVKFFKSFFFDMTSYLVENQEPNQLVSQFGYQQNGGFANGNIFINKDGSISDCDSSDNLEILKEQFIPKGNIDDFRLLLNQFFQLKGISRHKVYALALLSTPILSIVDTDGSFINLKSTKSGLGKSLTQKFIQLFYRNKSKLDNDFSRLSILNECALLNSYPILIEEISTIIKENPREIRQLIHNITGGSDKKRLDKNANQKQTKTFNLNLGTSSNPSIMTVIPPDSTAEIVRTFEINVEEKNDDSLAKLNTLIHKMKSHCGHGYYFISKILEQKEVIVDIFNGEMDYMLNNLYKDTQFRYVAATLSCTTTFAKLLQTYGIKVDMDEIDECIKDLIEEQKESFNGYRITSNKIINDLLAKLTLNHYNMSKGFGMTLNEYEQYNNKNDGIILNKSTLIIPKSIFDSKVAMNHDRRTVSLFNLTPRDLINELNKDIELCEVKQISYLGTRTSCVSIDLIKSGHCEKLSVVKQDNGYEKDFTGDIFGYK